MGNFYVNYQVRGDSTEPVVTMARRACCGPAYIARPRNGWVGVFDEASDSQDQAMMHQVARDLSDGLDTAVFAFLVHDSDVFYYLLYERGELTAEFDSWPDYYQPSGHPGGPDAIGSTLEGAAARDDATSANPDAVLAYCVPGTTLEQVRDLLDQVSWSTIEAECDEDDGKVADAFDRHQQLARLLGLDEELTHMGFRHVEERVDEEGRKTLPGIRKVRGKGKKRYPRLDRPPRSLVEAVEIGDLDAVRRFLAAGADPNARDQHGRSVLFVAACGGHFEIGLALLAALAETPSDAEVKGTAMIWLSATVQYGRPDMVPALLASGPAFPAALDDALFPAVVATSSERPTRNQVEALEALIRAGADVNAEGWRGATPLTVVVDRGHREFVAVLLKWGAAIDRAGEHGRTPLIHAVIREARSPARGIVRLLLDAGADPNARDSRGTTALTHAVVLSRQVKIAARLISELLRAGADVNAEDEAGGTALSAAPRPHGFDEVVALLRAAGAE